MGTVITIIPLGFNTLFNSVRALKSSGICSSTSEQIILSKELSLKGNSHMLPWIKFIFFLKPIHFSALSPNFDPNVTYDDGSCI